MLETEYLALCVIFIGALYYCTFSAGKSGKDQGAKQEEEVK